jgi:hypothetical protein
VRFEALAAVKIVMLAFWVVTLCILLADTNISEKTFYLHLQRRRPTSTVTDMFLLHSSFTFIETNEIKRCFRQLQILKEYELKKKNIYIYTHTHTHTHIMLEECVL